jgi:hypothetical protein
MGRWSQYDTDEERLPEGMTRIGYDADEEVYTFRDTDGSIWESAPGNQYGRLTRVSRPPPPRESFDDETEPEDLPPPYEVVEPEVSWRHEMMPLFNFFLIIGLFMIGVFFYLRGAVGSSHRMPKVQCGLGTVEYGIKGGDTCWAIAQMSGSSVDALRKENRGLNCDALKIGHIICVPEA